MVQLVGNTVSTTQDDLVRAEEKQTFNSAAMTLNKAGTVSNFIALCAKAERLGFPILAVDEGEDCDDFTVHMAVGMRCAQIRLGGLLGGHAKKYNELLRLEDAGVAYIGDLFRK